MITVGWSKEAKRLGHLGADRWVLFETPNAVFVPLFSIWNVTRFGGLHSTNDGEAVLGRQGAFGIHIRGLCDAGRGPHCCEGHRRPDPCRETTGQRGVIDDRLVMAGNSNIRTCIQHAINSALVASTMSRYPVNESPLVRGKCPCKSCNQLQDRGSFPERRCRQGCGTIAPAARYRRWSSLFVQRHHHIDGIGGDRWSSMSSRTNMSSSAASFTRRGCWPCPARDR